MLVLHSLNVFIVIKLFAAESLAEQVWMKNIPNLQKKNIADQLI